MTLPWVRVVIVNYNAGALLQAAIDGLSRQDMQDFEAVIIDNASTDGSIDRLLLPDPRFRIQLAGANIGFAAGCNLGAAGAKTLWVAMLNPDAVPSPDWLSQLRAATERYPLVNLFGSTQLMAGAQATLDGAGDNYSIFGIAWRGGYGASALAVDEDYEVFSPCAAAALYRQDAFAAAGGFAENYFCYLEDVDLGFRMRLLGHRCRQVALARVSHAGSAIAGRASPFTHYHSTRNGLYLLIRCMPGPLLFMALPLFIAAQFLLMTRRGASQVRLKGLADGIRAWRRLWKERKEIQAARKIDTLSVARLLTWNPLSLVRRHAVRLRG